jgi:hypothetical protein
MRKSPQNEHQDNTPVNVICRSMRRCTTMPVRVLLPGPPAFPLGANHGDPFGCQPHEVGREADGDAPPAELEYRAPGCAAAEKRSSTVPPGLRPAAMRCSRGSIHLPTVAALPPSLVRRHDQPFCTASTDSLSPQLSLFRNFAITLTWCSRPDSVERRLPDDAANDRPTKRNVHRPIPVPCRGRLLGQGRWGWDWDCSRG